MTLSKTLALNNNGDLGSLAEASFPAVNWYPQQVSWVRDPTTAENAAHNFCLALRIHGLLHRDALQTSLQELVQRHESLRSVFRLVGTRLIQYVLPAAQLVVSQRDFANVPLETAEAKVRELAVEEALQPFDLRKSLLLWPSLFRLRPDAHLLLLTTHHAVCDDWSVGILLRDLSALYSARAAQARSPLPPVRLAYSRFATELAARIEAGKMQPQIRFWKQYLAGAGDFHFLVPDYARPSQRSYGGAHKVWHCPEMFAEAIRGLAAREQVSPFMVLLGAFQCLLARASGQHDIGVGACVANRLSTDVEELVGPLSNRIILRTDLSGDPSLRDVLRRTRASSLDVYSCQDLPFGNLAEAVAPAPASNQNPLFQVLMILKEDPLKAVEFCDLDLSWLEIDTRSTRYDLNVWLQFKPGQGLEVDFQYNRELFKSGTISRLLENYGAFLRSMVENLNLRISEVPLVPPHQREPVPVIFRHGNRPAPATAREESRLRAIFEEILGARPIDVHSDFFALGGSSLQAAQVFARIEREFQIKLPFSTLLRAGTVAQLAEIMRSDRARAADSSLVVAQPFGSRPPLFCVHSHRGDVLFCGALSRHLGPGQPVFGIQSRGLADSPHFTVQEMADHYVQELLRFQPSGPYLLFGYSFGGLVAFEMSHKLLAKQRNVAFLGMFNTPAPGSLTRWPLGQPSYLRRRTSHALETSDALVGRERLAHLARKASNFSRMLVSSARTDFWRFAARFLGRVAAQRFGERILDVEHINIAAAKEYRPQESFPGEITFFVSRQLPYLYSIAPRDGWSPFATRGVELVEVPDADGLELEAGLSRALKTKLDGFEELAFED